MSTVKGKVKVDVSLSKKRSESSSNQSLDSRTKSASVVTTKTEVKSKTTTTTKVREKKVYTLPGQKHDPPEEREPLRIFYESLSKQIPTSEMAEFWLMEHGMLSPEAAKRAHEKKQRKQKQLRTGTTVKSSNQASNKPESSRKQNGETKAKRRINDDSDEDDFVFSPKKRKG